MEQWAELSAREADPGARIVLLEPARLGDVAFMGPALRALSVRNPLGERVLVVRPKARAVAARMRGVDRVEVFDKAGADRGRGVFTAGRRLGSFDIAYTTHPSIRSALYLSRVKDALRVGTSDIDVWSRPFYSCLRTVARTSAFVNQRLQLIGCPEAEVGLRGTLERRAESEARVGLVVGAAWPTKKWSIEGFSRLTHTVLNWGLAVSFIGSPQEQPIAQAICRSLPPKLLRQITFSFAPNVEDLIRSLETCRWLVGGDTGPVHVGRALGCAAVVLFGPTSLAKHVPSSSDLFLHNSDLPCRPCHPHGPRRCPRRHHRCMLGIEPKDVIFALRSLIYEPRLQVSLPIQ